MSTLHFLVTNMHLILLCGHSVHYTCHTTANIIFNTVNTLQKALIICRSVTWVFIFLSKVIEILCTVCSSCPIKRYKTIPVGECTKFNLGTISILHFSPILHNIKQCSKYPGDICLTSLSVRKRTFDSTMNVTFTWTIAIWTSIEGVECPTETSSGYSGNVRGL